jgi:hypothetical protein
MATMRGLVTQSQAQSLALILALHLNLLHPAPAAALPPLAPRPLLGLTPTGKTPPPITSTTDTVKLPPLPSWAVGVRFIPGAVLQTKVDKAVAGGGTSGRRTPTLSVPPGDYHFGSTAFTVANGHSLHIKGAGNGPGGSSLWFDPGCSSSFPDDPKAGSHSPRSPHQSSCDE